MKATLKFNIPEEDVDFNITLNAVKYYCVITDMDNYIREIVKYNPDNWSDKDIDLIQSVRNKLHQFLADHEVDIN